MAGRLEIFLAACYSHMRFNNAAPVIGTDGNAIVLDLSIGSRLRGEAVANLEVEQLGRLIDETMADAGTGFAFGRYAEPRDLYNNDHFASDSTAENRTVHMGIDLFCVAGTPVSAPLDGKVELLANNARELDYGPMLVLRHEGSTGEDFFLRCTVTSAQKLSTSCKPGNSSTRVNKLRQSARRRRMATGRHTCISR